MFKVSSLIVYQGFITDVLCCHLVWLVFSTGNPRKRLYLTQPIYPIVSPGFISLWLRGIGSESLPSIPLRLQNVGFVSSSIHLVAIQGYRTCISFHLSLYNSGYRAYSLFHQLITPLVTQSDVYAWCSRECRISIFSREWSPFYTWVNDAHWRNILLFA